MQSLGLALVSINVYAKLYQNISKGLQVNDILRERSEDFFRIWSSAKPRPMINVISQSLGWSLSVPVCVQNFITIFHSVQEIGPFSLFQNSKLGKASTNYITQIGKRKYTGHRILPSANDHIV